VLAVVHAKAKDSIVTQAKQRTDAEIFTVTSANRDALPEKLKKHLLALN
jgi:nucleoside-triphosphatase THEP1